ncbi:MAG: hypothetical protein PHO01_07940 [Desulfotomaculaceae bacterium]|nr:hypothetical protein [Desulfotomaculaceae bacterium]
MEWNKLSVKEQREIYSDVLGRLYSLQEGYFAGPERDTLRREFMSKLPTDDIVDILEREIYKKMYGLFFNDWLTLDYRAGRRSPTMVENILKEKLDIFPGAAERTVLNSLAKSFVAPYRILKSQNGITRMENIILPRRNYYVYTPDHEFIVGDIMVTRLYPAGKQEWLLMEPWLLLMPFDEKLMAERLHNCMKREGFSRRETSLFCKKSLLSILQVANRTIIDVEKEIAASLAPLAIRPEWQQADLPNTEDALKALSSMEDIEVLETDTPGRFLLHNSKGEAKWTWTYIALEDDKIRLCIPPREDSAAILDTVARALSNVTEQLDFERVGCTTGPVDALTGGMILDFSKVIARDGEAASRILIPRRSLGGEIDSVQADFFAKLSLEIGKILKEDKS